MLHVSMSFFGFCFLEEAVKTKICIVCKEEKLLDEFYMKSRSKLLNCASEETRKRNTCKKCHIKEGSKNYWSKSAEERKKLNKERGDRRWKKHGERRNTEARKRYAEEKEKDSEWYQEYKRKARECVVVKGAEAYPRAVGKGLKETTCMDCKELKPVNSFSLRRENKGAYYRSYCNNCIRKRNIIKSSKRRALELACKTHITLEQWERKTAEWNYLCAYCGNGSKNLTMDHMVPLSRGGENGENNIVPACRSCNFTKHTKTAEEFFLYLEGKGEAIGFLVNGSAVSPLE